MRGFAGLWFTAAGFEQAWAKFLAALNQQHEKNPTVANVPRERALAASGLAWSGKPLDRILAAMAAEGRVLLSGTNVRSPEFRVSSRRSSANSSSESWRLCRPTP